MKRRVSSYFDLDLEPKTARMISEANFISFIQVTSELEALLLEARLIRKYMPHYNIAAKDDKHPLYIRISKEKYPRIVTARKIEDDPTSLKLRGARKNLAFYGPFPSSRSVYSVLRMLRRIFPYSDHKLGKRGCLYSHIGLCNPCPNNIEGTEDAALKAGMYKKYKMNIRKIKSILDGKIDVVTKDLEKEMATASKGQNYEEAAAIRNQIEHLEYITRPQMPTDFYMQNPNLYTDQRETELRQLLKILSANGIKIENLKRIECFDIAHLAGVNATASMVTFIDAEADKKEYRHFKIRKAKGGDDYDSMREVGRRRMNHLEDWGKPDLIIVDGGRGQVAAFSEVVAGIPIVGIAKHPDRLIVGEQKIRLMGNPLNLVSRMRDEAHRFARRYHHKLVSRELTSKNQ